MSVVESLGARVCFSCGPSRATGTVVATGSRRGEPMVRVDWDEGDTLWHRPVELLVLNETAATA
jgi:hypothetical protein